MDNIFDAGQFDSTLFVPLNSTLDKVSSSHAKMRIKKPWILNFDYHTLARGTGDPLSLRMVVTTADTASIRLHCHRSDATLNPNAPAKECDTKFSRVSSKQNSFYFDFQVQYSCTK